ncbi:FG-GAP-like repeat-containing protein [Streptomyces sp. SS]|uniref:FG-GAP-like repeat-containing protein n=1 Tax=Streptomyces sp. SS TaxID=260742 RepID=UPI0002F9B533|nr:FG-GAP-like repeat-containing protein [Streptomyces sp. SS]
MPLVRPTRRRLAAAVTTVLAVTLGASVLAAPANAVPAASGVLTATPATTAADPVPYPKGSRLAGAGVTGFLTTAPDNTTTFRRYSDGEGQAYTGATYLRSTRTTDYLVIRSTGLITQRNLTTSGSLQIAVGSTAADARYAGAAADAVFTTRETEAGTVLRKYTETDTAGTTVTGLPTDAIAISVTPTATPEQALVTYRQGSVNKWGVLDLATASVTVQDSAIGRDAVSGTRAAWATGEGTYDPPQVRVADLVTGAVQEAPVTQAPSSGNFHVALIGDWVVYGQPGGMSSSQPSVHSPLTAYNLTTKKSVKLLDHAYQLAPAPDGSLYARGGIVGQGEGIYRFADTGGETPGVEKAATTGEPTELVVTNAAVPPAVLDLDENDGFTFRWNLSREMENATVTVRHVRTGKTQTSTLCCATAEAVFSWQDNNWDEDVPNGDYAWEIVARPDNGIGPAAVGKGTFKVVRKTAPHDFNDNGTPDLLTRDSAGRLWRTDLFYRPIDEQMGVHEAGTRTLLGSGWNIYDRIEATGDLGGSPVGDILAREKSGVLWLYPGNGVGSFGTRVKVGTGWQIYDKIAVGSDLTGDGRPDALATDRSGGLWLYPGTGDATKPFAGRKQIGTGWGVYNELATVGNIAGGPAGDLVARDAAGVLWQYLGKGDGTFAPRTRLGAGWNRFSHLIGAGDADGDGRPDLLADSNDFYYGSLYKGTGDWKAPFLPAETMFVPPAAATDHVF